MIGVDPRIVTGRFLVMVMKIGNEFHSLKNTRWQYGSAVAKHGEMILALGKGFIDALRSVCPKEIMAFIIMACEHRFRPL